MRTVLAAATIGLAVIAAACTSGEETATEPIPGTDRTVNIDMRDMRFVPDELTVREGETIGFRFTNTGAVDHDAFIGDKQAQDEHEQEMRMMREEHGRHSTEGDGGITVEPGATGTIKHLFTEKGSFEIGCHQPGHYAVGMVVKINVG